MVALININVDAAFFSMVLDQSAEIFVGGAAVNVWFADAKHVEVWAVNDA